jgi:hypothetical protein
MISIDPRSREEGILGVIGARVDCESLSWNLSCVFSRCSPGFTNRTLVLLVGTIVELVRVPSTSSEASSFNLDISLAHYLCRKTNLDGPIDISACQGISL